MNERHEMRLQMRYESSEMGMDDEHWSWSLNIMLKLANHQTKEWEKEKKYYFQGFGNTATSP